MGLSGGEVITTPFTFVATSHALKRIGAKPVFANIDLETMCLSPEAAEKMYALARTKAIVPVHVYGDACDVAGFARIGEKYGVKIIYNAVHVFGGHYHIANIYGDYMKLPPEQERKLSHQINQRKS